MTIAHRTPDKGEVDGSSDPDLTDLSGRVHEEQTTRRIPPNEGYAASLVHVETKLSYRKALFDPE
jgi:hypothetical protein